MSLELVFVKMILVTKFRVKFNDLQQRDVIENEYFCFLYYSLSQTKFGSKVPENVQGSRTFAPNDIV